MYNIKEDWLLFPDFGRCSPVSLFLASLLALFPVVVHAQEENFPLINVTGVDAELQANILSHLQVSGEACDVSLQRLQRQTSRVRDDVIRAANALGYYQSTSTIRFSSGTACWQLDLEIVPGMRVLLDDVLVQVAGSPEEQGWFNDIVANSPLRTGSALNHGQYETVKNALSSRAADNGFFGARFEQAEVAVDMQTNEADVNLLFDPGQQYHFGVISISSDGNLSEELIRRLMPIREGGGYTTASLAELNKQLDASQYFRQIRVAPQLRSAVDQSVPIQVNLLMRPRQAWTGGIGYTTDTGPRTRLSYENRYVNTGGHKIFADATLSAVQTQVNGSYVIPLADAARQSLTFAAGFSSDDTESFENKQLKLRTALRNESSSGWQQTAFIDFQRDDFVVDVQEATTKLTMPGISLSKTVADNLINPSQGWKLFSQLRGASDSLLSDSTFVQLSANGKYVMSFGRSRLLTRLDLGATWIDEKIELPASLRYFAGGDQSIRGFEYQALGPLNANGEVVGGKQLIVGSVEYDFQVRDKWRVAAFVDSGNAFDNTSAFEFQHSAGIGIRWLSPIGQVRVDIAHPFDAEESFRLHITMGPDL
ncbi:MAG: autotransporter assembly complex family protein [Pseudomonadota bacterium]